MNKQLTMVKKVLIKFHNLRKLYLYMNKHLTTEGILYSLSETKVRFKYALKTFGDILPPCNSIEQKSFIRDLDTKKIKKYHCTDRQSNFRNHKIACDFCFIYFYKNINMHKN